MSDVSGRSFADVFGEIGKVWDTLVEAVKVQTGEICGLKQRAVCSLDAMKNLETRVTRIEALFEPARVADAEKTDDPVAEDAPTPDGDPTLPPLEYTLTFKLKPDELAALATLHESDADIIMALGGVEAFVLKVYNRQAATLLVEMGKTARAVIAKSAAQSQFPYRDDGQ